jgi:hypothetical protein
MRHACQRREDRIAQERTQLFRFLECVVCEWDALQGRECQLEEDCDCNAQVLVAREKQAKDRPVISVPESVLLSPGRTEV